MAKSNKDLFAAAAAAHLAAHPSITPEELEAATGKGGAGSFLKKESARFDGLVERGIKTGVYFKRRTQPLPFKGAE